MFLVSIFFSLLFFFNFKVMNENAQFLLDFLKPLFEKRHSPDALCFYCLLNKASKQDSGVLGALLLTHMWVVGWCDDPV